MKSDVKSVNEIPKLLLIDSFKESILDEIVLATSSPDEEHPSSTVKSSFKLDFAFSMASENKEVKGEITIEDAPVSSIDGKII